MIRQLISLIALILSFQIAAQNASPLHKLDFMSNSEFDNLKVSALIKGDINKIKAYLSSQGKFKYAHGDIASVQLQLKKVRELETKPWVDLVEIETNNVIPLSDTMLINNNIIPLHNSQSPLTDSLDGEGVIIGFLDTGVDFNHDDFKDVNGNSRIISIWDHTDSADVNRIPAKYGYGQVWSKADIDNGICIHDDPANYYGHGTMVVGVAAGNGLASNQFKGVAPKSDIVVVAMDFDINDFNSSVADAIDYIFNIADSLGKPCVINTSVGEYSGSHDGSDLSAQIIDTMIKAKNGRIVVASAGNAGNIPFHLKVDVSSDTLFTCFEPDPANAAVYMDQIYGEIDSLKDVYISIACHRNDNAKTKIGTTEFFKVSALNLSPSGGAPVYNFKNVTAINGGYTIASCVVVLKPDGINLDKYYLQFYTYGDSIANYTYSLNSTGVGLFDVWSNYNLIGSSNITTSIPDTSTYPEFKKYIMPDYNSTLVSSWQCLPSVTTVANYTNRMSWLDYNNNPQTQTSCGYSPTNPGEIAPTSSLGPTRNGLMKPDITASGNFTFSSARLATAASFATSNTCKLAPTGKHTRNGGTSTSSPVVAGVAALFLQQFPNADYNQFQQHIKNTADSDDYTGAVPNNQWGFGKLNGYEVLNNAICPTINISTMTTDVICNGGNDGTVSLNITGGTAPYNIDMGGADSNALSAGSYIIIVNDSFNCNTLDSIIVNEPTALSISTSTTNVSCNGVNDGTASINVSGGIAPYNINLNGVDTNALSAGNFALTIIDSNGCTKNDSFFITEPALLIIDTIINRIICFGDTNGSISLNVSGGYGAYSYNWSNNSIDSSLSNIGGGTYSVTISDDNYCSDSLEVIIAEPNQISLSLGNDTTICSNDSLTINIQSFDSILWNTGENTTSIEVSDSGIISVMVMDSLMCSASDSMNVFVDSSQIVLANFGYQIIGDSVILSDSSINGINYYWDFGDSSYDSTISPTHIYQSSGSYFILLTTANNCFTDSTGQWINIIMTNLDQREKRPLTIYPNPTNGFSNIRFKNNQLYPIYLKIYDNFGKLVHEHQWSDNKAEGSKKIDLSEFANGQYYFEFSGKDFKQTHKVIID